MSLGSLQEDHLLCKVVFMKTKSPISIRFDKNAVVLFDKRNGTKLRFAIGKYDKASKPELVDICISDFCPFACNFCYMGSTLEGEHSTMEQMDFIISELSRVGVQECALGGGEPTSHPHFIEILEKFHAAGIVPNFTTKTAAMVRKLWPQIGHLIGGFAYSAETPAQVRAAAKLLTRGNVPLSKGNLHYVMGLGDREHFREYLETAHEVGMRVTLLGYKTSGRGKDVIPHPYDWWIDEVSAMINRKTCPDLSIDTPLAEQYDGKMPIENHMRHLFEGQYSMYLHAPTMMMGASSFDEAEELVPFDKNWRKIYRKRSFAKGQWGDRLV